MKTTKTIVPVVLSMFKSSFSYSFRQLAERPGGAFFS